MPMRSKREMWTWRFGRDGFPQETESHHLKNMKHKRQCTHTHISETKSSVRNLGFLNSIMIYQTPTALAEERWTTDLKDRRQMALGESETGNRPTFFLNVIASNFENTTLKSYKANISHTNGFNRRQFLFSHFGFRKTEKENFQNLPELSRLSNRRVRDRHVAIVR
jgi:hypothetical protein